MKMRHVMILALCLASSTVTAAAPEVSVTKAWVRWLPAGVPLGGYFRLANEGDSPLLLSGVAGDDFTSVSIHETVRSEDGKTTMRPADLPLHVQPGAVLEFAPGGYHLMLFGAPKDLRPGDEVRLTLKTANGGAIPVRFEVRGPGGGQ